MSWLPRIPFLSQFSFKRMVVILVLPAMVVCATILYVRQQFFSPIKEPVITAEQRVLQELQTSLILPPGQPVLQQIDDANLWNSLHPQASSSQLGDWTVQYPNVLILYRPQQKQVVGVWRTLE